jgi:hypothetical protein
VTTSLFPFLVFGLWVVFHFVQSLETSDLIVI